jgi:hypothetical protein
MTDKPQPILAAAIEHMREWEREQAINGPVTGEQLDGIGLAIAEHESF